MVHTIFFVLTLVASHLHLTAGQDVCRDNNWTSGVHRHPDRCDYYVTCVNSVPSLYQCLKGLIFDTVLGTCAEPSIAHPCNESANTWPELTGDYQDFCNYKHLGTGVHLYPGTCDKFIYCTNSETFVVYCAVGHLYDPDYGACVEGKTAKSCSNDTNQNIIPGNFTYCQDNNWKNGSHPHPHTCIMYVVCSNYQTTVVPCQRGLLFDIKFRTCVDSKVARPCDDDPWSNITIAPQCRNISQGDILFILDSSSSIGYPNYKLQLRFVANLTQAFTIGPNNVQFGVVIFSEEAASVFRFDAYREAESLIQAINQVEYISGPTFTDSALALAYQMFIPGAYGARANVPHIAIVLTDGLSANKTSTLLEAQKLKAAGVRVLGIGIGHFDQQELRGIASSQKEVFMADSYSVIHNLTDDITISLCKKVSIPKCSEAYADVILVMDESGSIGSTNFQIQLEFASNLVQNFPIGPGDVRFAALSFSGSVHKLFDLKTYNYANQMAQVFLRTGYDGGGTNTAGALQYIRLNDMFGAAAGGRLGATKIIIVMTDGESNDANQTAIEAGILKDLGYHMMSIGIGSGVNLVELATLSTNVSNRFTVDNYDILSRLHEDVAGRACEIQVYGPLSDYSNFCEDEKLPDGRHRHPADCTRYIECTSAQTDIKVCPAGSAFDLATGTCSLANYTSLCLGIDALSGQLSPGYNDTTKLCSQNGYENGIYPHPSTCSFYLKCLNFITIEESCPVGTVFDPSRRGCVDPRVAFPCHEWKNTNLPTVYEIKIVCEYFRLQRGIYPDTTKCDQFVECVNGATYNLQCPTGLRFNSRTGACDTLSQVNCNDNYNFRFDHST